VGYAAYRDHHQSTGEHSVSTIAPNGTVNHVVYNVWVNEILYKQPYILDAELWMEYGCHDLFFLRIELPRGLALNKLSLWPDDTPIRIQWGRQPDTNMWYGYVNHHQIQSVSDSGTKAQQIEYVCIGTSQVLNADKSRSWTSVSPTYIAKKIASENNLRAVVSPINWVLDYEAQANESDHKFLIKIANKTGMRYWCSNGTLYMVKPDIKMVGNQSSTSPIYQANKLFTHQDTIRNFEILKGNNIPGSVVASRAIFGIDQVTGQAFSAVNQQTGTNRVVIKQDTSVANYYDAKNRIDASAALSQFNIQASAQLFGNTTLYPGKVVNLQGVSMPAGMIGEWLVTCTKHKLLVSYIGNAARDIYVVDVILVRNTPTGLNLTNVQPIIPEFTGMGLSTLPNGQQWTCFQPNVVTEQAI
jgi:phage protein D